MSNIKRAIIIGTEFATNGFESGASLRLKFLEKIVSETGFKTEIVSIKNARKVLENNFDLAVVVSFSSASILRKARRKSKALWYDPTDSWKLTRFSLLKSGDLKQVFLLLRDTAMAAFSPKVDLITFITRRDAISENAWAARKAQVFILPISNLDRKTIESSEKRLVFVGDGNYGPNKLAIEFLEKVARFIKTEYQIHVYGREIESTNPKFNIHGYSVAENLYYSRDIHLAPIFYGAGMKLKVAIPLWNGLNVIASKEASVGFCLSNSLHLANSAEEFADNIINLMNSDEENVIFPPKEAIYADNDLTSVMNWLISNFNLTDSSSHE